MAALAAARCTACGMLNALEQITCLRCGEPLSPQQPTPSAYAITGDTCHIYRGKQPNCMLTISSRELAYMASGISFSTEWHNVAHITQETSQTLLWLYQTPQNIRLQLGSGEHWLSNRTRTIPLNQFGYPHNQALISDLACYAPHLRPSLPKR